MTSETTHSGLSYRPDIDGLRAIAVLGVIFYHMGFSWISGGYVGVDVFFVISGYLITRNILARKNVGNFSIIDFFRRRFLRLFPALFATVVVTLLVALFVMPPQQLQETAHSGSAAIMAFANIFFWTQTGYWDAEILSKPLVHTWTLSVEEQFYLIWPFLLGLFYKVRSVSLFVMLGILGLISLVASIWMTPRYPEAAFYLMPFRVFEFVIGALCVGVGRRFSDDQFGVARAGLAVLGLGMIAYAYAMFDEGTAIPGSAVLIPTLGTAAVILARENTGSRMILSSKPVVYIGLLSYSLYLVHWPVLSFIDQIWGPMDVIPALGALAFIFVLSVVLYHGIEKPVRYARYANSGPVSRVFLGAVTGMLGISLATQLTSLNKGFPGRYQSDLEAIAALTIENVNASRRVDLERLCEQKTGLLCGKIEPEMVNILVIGDSHGPDGLNIMRAAAPKYNYLTFIAPACPPLTSLKNVFFLNNKEVCKRRVDSFYNEVGDQLKNLDLIVLSIRHEGARVPRITETIAWFEARGVKVMVLGPGPVFYKNLQTIILQYSDTENMTIAAHSATDVRVMRLDNALRKQVDAVGGIYISRAEYFCPDGNCDPFIENTRHPVVLDAHHLTKEAAVAFGEDQSSTITSILEAVLSASNEGE